MTRTLLQFILSAICVVAWLAAVPAWAESQVEREVRIQMERDQAELATGPKEEEETAVEAEESAQEEGKWWNISLTYSFSHNIAKERPTATNALSIDPSFSLPGGVQLGLHVGANLVTEYDRTSAESGDGLRTFNTADFDVSAINVARPVTLWEAGEFTFVPSLTLMIPSTSRFQGIVNDWYFAYKPALTFSIGQWGLSLSNATSFQQNFHKRVFRDYMDEDNSYTLPMFVQFKVANTLKLAFQKWGLLLDVYGNVSRSWLYQKRFEGNEKIVLGYGFDVGYSFAETKVPGLEVFTLMVGSTTMGPELRNGGMGNDELVPFKPLFTEFYVALSASF